MVIESITRGAAEAKPFVKWAGGKRNLVPEIIQHLPLSTGAYWEPFVGGGAVFFGLGKRIDTANISDVNQELALLYRVVRDRPEELVKYLTAHAEQHSIDTDYFYQVRKTAYSHSAVEVAARCVYLNKTCYNGLYRVNKKGDFNAPKGSHKNPLICDADGIRRASRVLQKAAIRFGDFGTVEPGERDFVYCDPPYDGTFNAYTTRRFNDDDQQRLRDAALRWHTRGASVMISNADTPLIRKLYAAKPFVFYEVTASRSINCHGSDRGQTTELLITTYAAQN